MVEPVKRTDLTGRGPKWPATAEREERHLKAASATRMTFAQALYDFARIDPLVARLRVEKVGNIGTSEP